MSADNPWLQEDVAGTNKSSGYDAGKTKKRNYSDTDGWKPVVDITKSTFGFTREGDFKTRVDKAADLFVDENGRWPTVNELVAMPEYIQYMSNLAAGFPYLAPPTFMVDGVLYYNDPMSGPEPIRAPSEFGSELAEKQFMQATRKVPKYTGEQFANLMQSLAPARGGGSGGRGGAGRTNRAFDRDQLIEAGADRWKGLMLEDPADIERYVDQYIDRANAFWVGEGGSLDFDTFLVNKMRETSRYKTLYQKKAPELTEEEYMARYRGVAESFGINQTATRRETEAGLRAGVGQAGFQERVEKTREARLANTGRFSQQLASQMAQMGAMG